MVVCPCDATKRRRKEDLGLRNTQAKNKRPYLKKRARGCASNGRAAA
jgi:hypothetical protein